MRIHPGLLLCCLPTLALAAGEVDSGQWQITSQVEMPGQPKMAPVTISHCVSEADAKDPAKTMAAVDQQLKAHNCQVTERRITASTVNMRMQCKGQMEMSSHSQFSYTRNSYQGTVQMNMNGMQINSTVSARRIGACKQ